ncbi:MAG: zinc-binding alcohol dehydrogenase [Kiritimatiellae bacterium]|nr:zinc-binding alcohol dehydrogenase [Kiritimatiellia bacterium]
MKSILFTAKNKAELVDEPMPVAAPGEVVVKLVRSCISSGTERANVSGLPDCATGIFGDENDMSVTFPRRGGYSSSGVVESVGDGVECVKPGDRVAMSWSWHRQFVSLPEGQVYRIPDGVSFQDAALAHIATFPAAAIRKCRLEFGEPAVVMGQGVLGQLAVKLLRVAGAMPVIAADPVPEKRREALRLGADFAFDPLQADFAEQVKAVTESDRRTHMGRKSGAGAKVAIEVTGNGAALNTVLDAVAPFARVALLGCTRDSNFTINYYRKVHAQGVSLIGAHTMARPDAESSNGWWTTRDDALAFLKMLSLGRISLDGFVAEVHSPAECGEVYARLCAGGVFPVVQFDWTRLG